MAGIKQIKPPIKKVKQAEDPQDTWLNECIDDYLRGTMYAPRAGVFYPSSLGNPCDRYLWLCYHGHMVDQPLPPNLQRIFQCGSSLEDRVAKWFTGLNILLQQEKSVRIDTPPISGRIDFVIKHYDYGNLPVELKSINKAGFTKLKKPKPEHSLQLQMYLNMGDYPMGTVLYECKDDQKIKSFLVERDVVEWEKILARCFRIQDMIAMPEKCTGAPWCACKEVGTI